MRFGLSRKHKKDSSEEAGATAQNSRGSKRDEGQLKAQGSSNDPTVLAAILASLQDSSCTPLSAAGHFLCRNLSEADPSVATQLRQRRAAQLHTSPDGVCYFEGDEDADHPLTLPNFQGYPPEVRQQALHQLCNEYLQREAETAGVINCVLGCSQLLVLNTQGDGNCLSHACSLGVWGVHDRDSQLRGAIRATMTHPVAGQDIKLRFELQLRQNGIPQEEWPSEWRRELAAFHSSKRMSDLYLSDVHCFALANVLRRPLLLYGDESAALAGLTGVYLPLLWPPSACQRDPVAVLFWGSHFSLLCTMVGEGPVQPQLLPLCTRDGPLQVRFLSASELKQHGSPSGSPPLALLQQYMDCEQMPVGSAIWQQQQEGQQEQRPPGPGAAHRSEGKAVGVRLNAGHGPQNQVLLHMLEAAYVAQTAAQLGCGRWQGSSLPEGGLSGGKRRSSLGRAENSRRGSLSGGPSQQVVLA